MEWRRASEDGLEFKGAERGWYVGSGTFRKELLAQMKEELPASVMARRSASHPRRKPGDWFGRN
jgi:hypothetical protein